MRKRWIQAVKTGEKNWEPKDKTIVCYSHFQEEDYKTETVDGTLHKVV